MTKLSPTRAGIFTPITLDQARDLPLWRRPQTLLLLMAFAMPVAFNTWSALLNNFVIEVGGFTGVEIGWLHTVREIPGFLAVGVIALLMLVREQILGLVALAMLGVATALTAYFPSYGGILMMTMLSSIGFHYFETVNQSLQLQWISKARAPQVLGWLTAAGAAASFIAYGLLVVGWRRYDLSYEFVYLIGGGFTALVAVFALYAYPQVDGPVRQHRKLILRKRYWLYYLLQFMAGARRQIFVVFAAFMMVERFGFDVHDVTQLFLLNFVISMVFAPLMGRAVGRFGEANVLRVEYFGLILVFMAYGGLYTFHWGVVVAMVLYVVDHMLFALHLALKTYFQKIAAPEDIAPTAAVAFTINHIAAVFLPALLGYIWITAPQGVFYIGAMIAGGSLALSLLIPRHPEAGNETRLLFWRGSAADGGSAQ